MYVIVFCKHSWHLKAVKFIFVKYFIMNVWQGAQKWFNFLTLLLIGWNLWWICINFFVYCTNLLKETRNSFKKWPLNLWWISNKTIIEAGNITKAATFKSFLHLSYKNTQLHFLWQCFLIFSRDKNLPVIFGG